MHMAEMPGVRVLAARAVQVGTGTFGTPKEWMVVHKFSRFGIFTVTLGFRTERPHPLRVTGITPLTDIYVAPL